MRGAAEKGHLVIGLGDFNMIPLSLAHRLITTHSPVRDVWRLLHPDSSVGAAIDKVEQVRRVPIPTSEYNLTENGATCDSVLNTWRWDKAQQKLLGPGRPQIDVAPDTVDPKAKRLDYIFASNGFRDESRTSGWVVKGAKVGFTERHPELQCSLSDHFSVEATLVWHNATDRQDTPTKGEHNLSVASGNGTFLHSPTSSNHARSKYDIQLKPALGDEKYLPIRTYDEIIAMIEKYTLRERKQRRYRLYHFGASLFIAIGCLVAVWWSPRNFVAFILMLISTLGLSAGVIDGLIGGLFVGSELRALKEFMWEINMARAAASGSDSGDVDEAIKDW
jgi:sphingomyelin phosphodiesterase 2